MKAQTLITHELKQATLYTFYFCVIQMIILLQELRAQWSLLAFIVLLMISHYEDLNTYHQNNVREIVLVLRTWATTAPLLVSTWIFFMLERGDVIKIQEDKGPKLPFRPRQMVVYLYDGGTGYPFLDDCFIAATYFLYYFQSFCSFRSLLSQARHIYFLWEVDDQENPNDQDDGNGDEQQPHRRNSHAGDLEVELETGPLRM